jgi:hypothetical protein
MGANGVRMAGGPLPSDQHLMGCQCRPEENSRRREGRIRAGKHASLKPESVFSPRRVA